MRRENLNCWPTGQSIGQFVGIFTKSSPLANRLMTRWPESRSVGQQLMIGGWVITSLVNHVTVHRRRSMTAKQKGFVNSPIVYAIAHSGSEGGNKSQQVKCQRRCSVSLTIFHSCGSILVLAPPSCLTNQVSGPRPRT